MGGEEWVSDITYLRTAGGFLHLAIVLGLVFCNYHIYESSVLCFSILRIISPLVFDH
jgi:hypothetical protein